MSPTPTGLFWIDTHVHMDDGRFPDADAVRTAARVAGVGRLVIPAIDPDNFGHVRELAHRWGDAYALGIHPMYMPHDLDAALAALESEVAARIGDPRLVAIGEIGLDFFEEALCTPHERSRQDRCLAAQLALARRHGLPVLLHVRRSVDAVLKHLRDARLTGGIAHAFVGSRQQAGNFLRLGFKLGMNGAMTFERATRLQALAAELPLGAFVMETDAPDIAPSWLYATAAERAAGKAQGINAPAEIPRIGAVLATLRGITPEAVRDATTAAALQVLPRLAGL